MRLSKGAAWMERVRRSAQAEGASLNPSMASLCLAKRPGSSYILDMLQVSGCHGRRGVCNMAALHFTGKGFSPVL